MKIELKDIRKSYRKKCVLEKVSLAAGEGSCVGILGSNGCGKSTLLSILAGVQRADAGAFLCGEEDLLKNSSARTKVLAYVPQADPLMEELNAWDNLCLWNDRKTVRRELEGGVLELLGLNDFLRVPVRKMSGGMRKRLSIGCAVAPRPSVLLLDEPSAALDVACKEKIYRYLEGYKAAGGIILLTTHDAQELELCSQYYILKNGVLHPYEYDGNIHHLAGAL